MELLDEIQKSGYVLIDGFDVAEADNILMEYTKQIGDPITYMDLPMIMDLKPQPNSQGMSFAGTDKFHMHTDLSWYENPPPYISMFCVSVESAGGGKNLLADGWKIIEELSADDIEYLENEIIKFDSPDHILDATFQSPILSENRGKRILRFRYDLLETVTAPIQRLFEAINDNIIYLPVSNGTLFIADNFRMLHGRTSLKADLASDRHFKRMYGEFKVPQTV